jgi:hypothetical protein
MSISMLPTHPVLNTVFADNFGGEVVLVDAISVSPGDEFVLEFEEKGSPWKQGVWLGVDGLMEIAGHEGQSMQIWEDSALELVKIRILDSHGPLHLYNIWDRGRGVNSQAHTSGMVIEELGKSRRYRCQAINVEPTFSDLTFRLDKTAWRQ